MNLTRPEGAMPQTPPPPVVDMFRALLRRRALVAALVAVATLGAAWGASRLEIYTSRKALLPASHEASKRLEAYLRAYGAASDLIVVLDGGDEPDRRRFARHLAVALVRDPAIRAVEDRLDLDFLVDHLYLVLPPEQVREAAAVVAAVDVDHGMEGLAGHLEKVRRPFDAAPDWGMVNRLVALADRLASVWRGRVVEGDRVPVDWAALGALVDPRLARGGSFTSRDGSLSFLFVRPADISEEYAGIDRLVRAVHRGAEAVSAEWRREGRAPPRVGLTGLPAIAHEELRALRRDMVMTSVTAGVMVLLLIVFWLRSLRWAVLIFLPMGFGVLWNLGLASLLVGHLTMITASFTAILFGLGVDYGIFLSTRIREELAAGPSLEEAVARGAAASLRPLITAGGATVAIFAALATVEFPGFAELGVIAAGGVALVLLATFLLQPPLFALLPLAPPERPRSVPAPASGGERGGRRSPRLASTLLVLGGLALALVGAAWGRTLPFDYDVMKLLPKDSEVLRYQRLMVERSDYQSEVLIALVPSIEAARPVAEALESLPTVSRVESIHAFFPADGDRRAAAARELAAALEKSPLGGVLADPLPLLDRWVDGRWGELIAGAIDAASEVQEQAFVLGRTDLVAGLEGLIATLDSLHDAARADPGRFDAATRDLVGELAGVAGTALTRLGSWREARPLQPEDLPDLLRSRFFGADGTVAIYAFPAGSVYDPLFLDRLMGDVRRVVPDVTGFPATHQVFSKMVVESFFAGTELAALAALLWTWAVVRRLPVLALAMLPLLIGGGWMLAALAATGVRFNYANIIALPLVMGLAVDYGVWYTHCLGERPGESSWRAARRAGRAIGLAAATTLAGLGAITLASYRGVASLGAAITLGVICCLAAALLMAPAVAHLVTSNSPPRSP